MGRAQAQASPAIPPLPPAQIRGSGAFPALQGMNMMGMNGTLVAPSVCREPSPKREGVSVYRGFIFTANSSAKIQERQSERSPAPSWWPCPGGANIPCSHLPTHPREQRQTAPQRLTFLLDSFPPPPKAIWCFVYRESCHGEPACKSASTTACIKLANSCPKEPKKPWESQKNWRPLVWSGTSHVESTVPRCRGSHAGTAGGDRAGTEPGMAVGHQHSTEQPQCTAQAELRPSCSFCSPLWTSKSSPS